MTRPFLIAHLSDLHISLDHSRHIMRNVRRLLEHALRRGVDHIVVTGDITANADKRELETARRLFRNYGLLDAARLTIIPGNHDVYGGVHRAEEIFSFPRRCRTTDYGEKLERLLEAFAETFPEGPRRNAEKSFPFAKVFEHVAIVGLNSVARYSRMKNPIGSNGEIDADQQERLKRLLVSDPVRGKRTVVLVHHHFNKTGAAENGTTPNLWASVEKQTLKLRGKKELLNLFRRQDIRLVLHGHLHENHEYVRGGVHFANTGAAVLGGPSPLIHLRYVSVAQDSVSTMLQSISPTGLSLPQADRESPEPAVPASIAA